MISVQGKFLCNNVTEGFTFFMYNRDTKFERVTKQWQKEWQVSKKKDVLPAEYQRLIQELFNFRVDSRRIFINTVIGCNTDRKSVV